MRIRSNLNRGTGAALMLATMLAAAPSAHAVASGFALQQSIATPTTVTGVIVRDLDGDGDLDAFIAATDDYGLYAGSTAGVFAPAFEIPSGSVTSSPIVANLVGSGLPDLAVLHLTSDQIRIFAQTDLGFSPTPTQSFTVATARYMVAGRLDDNASEDIAIGRESGGVILRLNAGNGSFTSRTVTQTAYVGDAFPQLVDINADGRLDVAVTDMSTTGTFRTYANTGGGNFGPEIKYTGISDTGALTFGDVTGDGRPDALITAYSTPRIQIVANSGSGFANTAQDLPVCAQPQRVRVGEFNGDQYRDIAVTCFQDSVVRVAYGAANGGFVLADAITGINRATFLDIADVNRDDRDDLVVAGYSNGGIYHLRNTNTFPRPLVTNTTRLAMRRTSFNARARITPRYQVTRVRVQYGPVGRPMSRMSAPITIGRTTSARTVTIPLRGLRRGTRYRFRIVASAAAGTTRGPIVLATTRR